MGRARAIRPPRHLTKGERTRYEAAYKRTDKLLSAALEVHDKKRMLTYVYKMNDLATIVRNQPWLSAANKRKVERQAKELGVKLMGVPDPRFAKKRP